MTNVYVFVCSCPWMSTVVLYCWCHSDGASVILYFTFLSHLFPLPCGAGSTVPREGFDSKSYYAFFLVCCGCDTSYIVSVHIQCQASKYTLSLCRGHSWRVRLAKQETLTPPGHLVSPLVCRGPWMSTVVLYCWCHSDGASVILYFTFLSHLFPLPCWAGSTVPREGFDSNCYYAFFLVCCGCDTSYIMLVHIQCQASISTLSLCRGHSWRMRLAKQETLTPPGHLVSPLVCRDPWMSTVVLYCWCHSDVASVILYFTFLSHLFPLPCGAGSTVPREGFDSSVIMPFSWCVVAVTLPI